MSQRPTFDVYLAPRKARVWMNGVELFGVRDVKVHQPLASCAVVTIEFLADEVRGVSEPEPVKSLKP